MIYSAPPASHYPLHSAPFLPQFWKFSGLVMLAY
jgi:hypothetical protein